jgi:hypothetical protein
MKNRVVGFATVLSAVYLILGVQPAEARSIRVDDPGVGCDLTAPGWSGLANTTVGQIAFDPAGYASSDAVVTCTAQNSSPPTATNAMFNIEGQPVPNESYTANHTANFIATSGTIYQINNQNSDVSADVVVWDLAKMNGDVEIELNNWCGQTGANGETGSNAVGSFTWGKNTFSGGCTGNTTTNDLLFNRAGKLIGWVNDSTSTLSYSPLTKGLPAGWTEVATTPEIDPASAMAGLTLLAGCVAVLRGRRRTLYLSR